MAGRRLDPTCPTCGGTDRRCGDGWHRTPFGPQDPVPVTPGRMVAWAVEGLFVALLIAAAVFGLLLAAC